jgi:hypothetical protein
MRLRPVFALCLLALSCARAFAIDREAFTFTKYDLDARVEPEQQRLAVRGKITLRNDSAIPQKRAALQISSSLDWRSIQVGGQPVQFVSQPYTSDIDHTGGLSEAVVSFPQEIAPRASVDLEVGYEGTIGLDTTRLRGIGTPEDVARHSDWDQISPRFTAVRGVGYVAWYPVAMDSADLADGNSVFDTLGRWKAREADAEMKFTVKLLRGTPGAASPSEHPMVLLNADNCVSLYEQTTRAQEVETQCSYPRLGLTVPTFFAGDDHAIENAAVRVHYLAADAAAGSAYSSAAQRVSFFVQSWFGAAKRMVEVVELPDAAAAPFESGNMFLTPFSNDTRLVENVLVHQLTHAAFRSPRPWIYEGLAHFAQAIYREQQTGRQSALDFMGIHRTAVAEAEKVASAKPESPTAQSLITATSEEFYRSKAMFVWWMLRDMIGEDALKKALAAYRADDDKEPSYMQQLIFAQSRRDLEWFFDDWVYRDRGLPDFRVESAYPRATLGGAYVVTVSVDNLGAAGGEVPVTVRVAGGDVTKRLEVRGKAKASIRIEVPAQPAEVVVNDGSVPESDLTNNTFKVQVEQGK